MTSCNDDAAMTGIAFEHLVVDGFEVNTVVGNEGTLLSDRKFQLFCVCVSDLTSLLSCQHVEASGPQEIGQKNVNIFIKIECKRKGWCS
jgi:hypothetical protein